MQRTDEEKLAALSAAIDAVNRGDTPGGPDEETQELAGVALLLKQAGPPPTVVAGLVDTLGAELAAKKKNRRWLWLTSGAAGTAAAAVLVFALSTGPSAVPQPPLTPPPAGSVVIESVPVPPAGSQAVPEVAKADRKAPDTAKTDKGAAPAAPPAPAADNKTPAAEEKAPAAQSRPEATPGNGQAEQRTMLARVPDKAADKAQAEKSFGKAAVKAPPAGVLAWPGHEPDSVTVDKAAATVRQVYGSGEQAIVITQRVVTKSAPPDDTKAAPEKAAPPAADDKAQPTANKVTLVVKGMLVTVEGSQPTEELQKIARSLE